MNEDPAQPDARTATHAEAPDPRAVEAPLLVDEHAAVAASPAPSADGPTAPSTQQPALSADPWAHRRGEPRIFAFLWTLYLLAAVVGSVMWLAGSASLQADAYGPAARIMLVAIAAGVTILWPMTRLCQEGPEHPLRACIADVVVVVAPVQMIVWPLAFLAAWPVDVIAATAALLAVWGLLTGALLANALLDHPAAASARRPLPASDDGPPHGRALAQAPATEVFTAERSGLSRAGWMIGIIGVVFTGQLLAALGIATARPWLADLSGLSPFAGVYEVSGHGLTGAERPVTLWQWRLIAVVGSASLLVWVLALLRAAHARSRHGAP